MTKRFSKILPFYNMLLMTSCIQYEWYDHLGTTFYIYEQY